MRSLVLLLLALSVPGAAHAGGEAPTFRLMPGGSGDGMVRTAVNKKVSSALQRMVEKHAAAHPESTEHTPRKPGVVLRNMRRLVNTVGGGADKLAAKLATQGPRLQKTGEVIQHLFGTETLERTSALVNVSLVARVPHAPAALSVGANLWTGDVKFWENKHEYDDKLFNGQVTFGTLFGNVGYSSMTGKTVSPGFVVGGTYGGGGRVYGMTLGISGLATIAAGEITSVVPRQYARGAYFGGGGLVPGLHLGPVGVSVATMLFYPPLAGATQYLRKPAQYIRGKSDAIKHAVANSKVVAGGKEAMSFLHDKLGHDDFTTLNLSTYDTSTSDSRAR
jgi:hypothetical protein